MQGTKNLTTGPINKQLFKLAMPIMATGFIQMAYSLTDMAWVGRLSSEAVATIGSVGILVWMSTALSLLSKIGSEVSVAQSIGAHNNEDAKQFASHNVTIATLISLVWGGLLFVFATPIIDIYDLEPHISENAVSYLRIIATAFPFTFLAAAFTGIYNAAGRSNVPFYISGAGLILNIILDPIFIFVLDLKTDGAAYATWISQAAVLAMFVYNIRRRDTLLDGFAFFVKPIKKYTIRIIRLGLPVAIFNMLFAFVNMFLSRIASEQGGHIGLMTLTTGAQIEAITWNTAQGFSTALGTFIAQNYAAGEHDRVLRAWKTTLWMTCIFGSLTTLLFVGFSEEVFALFVPEVGAYQAGAVYLRISGYSQIFMMLEITTQGIFYGVGRTIPPAVTSIVCNYSRIPIAMFLASMGLGVAGIWWAVSSTSIAKGIILTLWFTLTRKKIFKNKQSVIN